MYTVKSGTCVLSPDMFIGIRNKQEACEYRRMTAVEKFLVVLFFFFFCLLLSSKILCSSLKKFYFWEVSFELHIEYISFSKFCLFYFLGLSRAFNCLSFFNTSLISFHYIALLFLDVNIIAFILGSHRSIIFGYKQLF